MVANARVRMGSTAELYAPRKVTFVGELKRMTWSASPSANGDSCRGFDCRRMNAEYTKESPAWPGQTIRTPHAVGWMRNVTFRRMTTPRVVAKPPLMITLPRLPVRIRVPYG